MSGEDSNSGRNTTDVHQDAVERFERVLDLQADLLSELDTKAEHVTRLVGVIVGVVLTAFSVAFQFGEGMPAASFPTALTFGLGTAALVVTLGLAVVTYLSSRLKLGLHPDASYTLQDGSVSPGVYSMLVMNSYASAIEENKEVLQANARRFRRTLVALLGGVSLLAIAVLQYVVLPSRASKWVALGGGLLFIGGAFWYVLTGRYLTLDTQ